MILPGVLWLGRNFIAQGVAFSPDVTRLQQWSIWNNLTNPWFYNYIPLDLIIVLVIGGVDRQCADFDIGHLLRGGAFGFQSEAPVDCHPLGKIDLPDTQ